MLRNKSSINYSILKRAAERLLFLMKGILNNILLIVYSGIPKSI